MTECQVKAAMDLYSQAELAALKVAHGDNMEVDTMSLDLHGKERAQPNNRRGTFST